MPANVIFTASEVPDSACRAYGRSLYAYDSASAGYGHRVAEMLSDPLVQEWLRAKLGDAIVRERVEAMSFAEIRAMFFDWPEGANEEIDRAHILAALIPPTEKGEHDV